MARKKKPKSYTFDRNKWIKQRLRKIWSEYPPRIATLNAAERLSGMYQCAACDQLYPKNEVEVDHVNPVVPITGQVSLADEMERMFCEFGFRYLRVLCKTCHHKISTIQNNQRRRYRRGSEDV